METWLNLKKKKRRQNSFLLSLIFSNQTWKILMENLCGILGQAETIWGACCQHIFSNTFIFSNPQWQAVNSSLGKKKKKEETELNVYISALEFNREKQSSAWVPGRSHKERCCASKHLGGPQISSKLLLLELRDRARRAWHRWKHILTIDY